MDENLRCAITRGMNYGAAVRRLLKVDPLFVERCEYMQEQDEARAQRGRNKRQAGLL